MSKTELNDYAYRGARALVLLHEKTMRDFLRVWQRAKISGVSLPETSDEDYASMETLLRHVLRAGRGYMVWMCEQLGLPDPGIRPAPDVERIESEAEDFVVHLLGRWRTPLSDVNAGAFDRPEYTSRWGVQYCIDAMLEHAVMHPLRHGFQLEELLEAGSV